VQVCVRNDLSMWRRTTAANASIFTYPQTNSICVWCIRPIVCVYTGNNLYIWCRTSAANASASNLRPRQSSRSTFAGRHWVMHIREWVGEEDWEEER